MDKRKLSVIAWMYFSAMLMLLWQLGYGWGEQGINPWWFHGFMIILTVILGIVLWASTKPTR